VHDGFWIVGHRGSPAAEVENTIPSFARAIAEGANAIELDVCVTRDREVVVWHDFRPNGFETLLRRWGLEPVVRCRPLAPSDSRRRRAVDELTLSELRAWYGYAEKRGYTNDRVDVEIPTLAQFFAWAARETSLGLVYIDTKIPDDRMALLPVLLERVDALEARAGAEFRIVFETASEKIAAELKRLAPHRELTLDIMPPPGIVLDHDAASAVCAARRLGLAHATAQRPRDITIRPYATHRRIVTDDLARLRELGEGDAVRELCAFTINDEGEMRELVELGVHAIQSDRPAELRRVVDAFRRSGEHGRRDRLGGGLREQDAVAVMPRREEQAG